MAQHLIRRENAWGSECRRLERAETIPKKSQCRIARTDGESALHQHRSAAPAHAAGDTPAAPRTVAARVGLDTLHSARFVDQSPAEVHRRCLRSRPTSAPRARCRVLAEAGEVRERRDQVRHPAYQTRARRDGAQSGLVLERGPVSLLGSSTSSALRRGLDGGGQVERPQRLIEQCDHGCSAPSRRGVAGVAPSLKLAIWG